MEAITWNYRVQVSNIEKSWYPFHEDGKGTEGRSGSRPGGSNSYFDDGRCQAIPGAPASLAKLASKPERVQLRIR